MEKDVFRLVTSVGHTKNSESPSGIDPKTFEFRAFSFMMTKRQQLMDYLL